MARQQINRAANLRLIAWNANSLHDKINELEELAHRVKADAILVSETFLKASDRDPKIRNFKVYRNDRAGIGGGTAIFIRQSLDHSVLTVPNLVNLEATAITIQTEAMGLVRFVAIYNSPKRDLLERDLNTLSNMDDLPFILAGDFNAKHSAWHSRLTNKRGRTLYNFALKEHLDIFGPEEPTYFSNQGYRPDVLDIAVSRRITSTTEISTLHELSSDHNPIIIDIGDDASQLPSPTHKITDWPYFATHLNQELGVLPTISNTQDLEHAVENLTAKIQQSIQFASRQTQPKRYVTPKLPPEILQLIQNRRIARRQWLQSQDPNDKVLYNRLTTKLRDEIRQQKNEQWKNTLEAADDDETKYWHIAKALRRKRAPASVIHGPNGLVYTAQAKAEAIASVLETQFSPNYTRIDSDFISSTHRKVKHYFNTHTEQNTNYKTPKAIHQLLKSTKLRKAPGPDGIPAIALRSLPRKTVVALTNIVNAILRLQYFPTVWKEATVITIPKPGKDPMFPQNYRPISLLIHLAKIAEKVLLEYLQIHTDQNNILPNEQFGFRTGHSTVHQLVRVIEYANEGIQNKMATGGIFLDVAKAFDKVWHQGLLSKLIKHGYPTPLVRIIASYLKGRKFHVRFLGATSCERLITAGVPQGSLLSPILFNIFVSDIPSNPACTTLAQYADDTAILYRSRSAKIITKRLQEAADSIEEWLTKWRIEVNPEKSSAIILTRRRIAPFGAIRIFDRPIPWRDKVTYLGVDIDTRLNFRNHTQNIVAKAKATFLRLLPLLGRHSKLSLRNKLRIYTAVIRPQMLYASPAWGHASKCTLKKLQVLQSKVLRTILSAPWYVRNSTLHHDTDIPVILDYMKSTAVRFFGKMDGHHNPSATLAISYDELAPTKHRRPKHVLCDV